MTIKLGPAGSSLKSSLEGVKFVKEHGLQAMEIEFVYGVKMSNELAKKIGELAKKLGISLSVHAPYYINLASDETAKRRASEKRILDSCERGHHLGAEHIVFHAAFFGKREPDEVYNIVKQAIEEMQGKIKKNNWNVRLSPETTGKPSQFGSLDELMKLSHQTGCSYCVDFAHIYARNHGKIDYKALLDKVLKSGKRLHIHFSGINYGPKGERNHLNMSVNKPPFEPLARELLKRKMDATIICESPVTWRDSLKMKTIFERLGYKF